MQKFSLWLESVGLVDAGATGSYDPNQTVDYRPMSGTARPTNATTVSYQSGGSGNSEFQRAEVDPAIATHVDNLKNMHTQLTQMFADIRGRLNAFQHPPFRQSFERELVTGIDSLGRAHAILQPAASGWRDR